MESVNASSALPRGLDLASCCGRYDGIAVRTSLQHSHSRPGLHNPSSTCQRTSGCSQSFLAAPTVPLVSILQPLEGTREQVQEQAPVLVKVFETFMGVFPKYLGYIGTSPRATKTMQLIQTINYIAVQLGLGSLPKPLFGLLAFTCSQVAQCLYCAAHSARFLLWCRMPPSKVSSAVHFWEPCRLQVFNRAERAAIDMAVAMASIPFAVDERHKQALADSYSPADAETIVLWCAQMGYANKVTDSLGVELEYNTLTRVSSIFERGEWAPGKHFNFHKMQSEMMSSVLFPSGPSSSAQPYEQRWKAKLKLLKLAPSIVRLYKQLTEGVPSSWVQIRQFLLDTTGSPHEYLGRISNKMVVQNLAAAIVLASESAFQISTSTKALAAGITSCVLGNDQLCNTAWALAQKTGVSQRQFSAACMLGLENRAGPSPAVTELVNQGMDQVTAVILLLAKALSYSPVRTTPRLVEEVSRVLSPESVMELINWVALQNMLHRLSAYYSGGNEAPPSSVSSLGTVGSAADSTPSNAIPSTHVGSAQL